MNDKGITLITLVITIAIIIILSGISISMLNDENSILSQSRNDEETMNRQAISEQINLAVIDAREASEYGEITTEKLDEKLDYYLYPSYSIEETSTGWLITVDGIEYEVESDQRADSIVTEDDIGGATVTEGMVARIGSTYYETLQEAFDAVPQTSKETEVILLENIVECVKVQSNRNVVLNLNGKTIDSNVDQNEGNYATITNYSIFKIIGEGTVNSENTAALQNHSGTLIIDGDFTFTSNSDVWAAVHNSPSTTANMTIKGGNIEFTAGLETKPAIENWGILEVTGGILNATNCCGIYNNQATLKINGDVSITACGVSNVDNCYGINNNQGTLSVMGGAKVTSNVTTVNTYNGNVIISGATIISNSHKAINSYSGKITVSGNAKITNNADGIETILVNAATLDVYGGEIEAVNSIAINIYSGSTVSIKGGTISNSSSSYSTIFNASGNTLQVVGGTIKNNMNYAVIENYGNANITGGSIINKNSITIANISSTGILNISGGMISNNSDSYSTIWNHSTANSLSITGGIIKNMSTADTAYELADDKGGSTIDESIKSSLRGYGF